jgi:peptidyl-prolyl cis-trans isomerase SurA
MAKQSVILPKGNRPPQQSCLLRASVWLWIVFIITPAGLIDAQEAKLVDRIVAVVNSDIITLYDLNRAFKPYETNIKALGYPPDKERETLYQVRSDLLSQLIQRARNPLPGS